jgi:1-acyl-sn-glycerol-3-phosphate acyltransferase
MARSKHEFVSVANFLYYGFLETSLSIAFTFFFRRFKVIGKENVSKTKPVLFAVNHQSSFVDPILVASFTSRRPWFITRAGVFSSPIARWFFNSFHMLPIYRLNDGVNIKEANEATFQRSREILKTGGAMLIFPEGNHGMRKRLRAPLKKGFARIALEADAETDFTLGVDIVPTGMFYEHSTKFRSDCSMNYGKPINTADYAEFYRKDPIDAYRRITQDLAVEMSKVLVDIHSLEDYDALEKEWQEARPKESDLEKRLETDRALVERLNNGERLKPIKRKENKAARVIFGILGLPFFIYGALNNLLSYITTKWVLKNLIKDPHFYHSIMLACGLGSVVLFTFIQSIVVYFSFGHFGIALLYLLTTPFFGILAYDYYDIVFRGEVRPQASKLMDGYGH